MHRSIAAIALVALAPLFVAIRIAMWVEGAANRDSRGSLLFDEERFAGGRSFRLLKFRVLRRHIIDALPPGSTHIKSLEQPEDMTRVGSILKQWYLDEVPQLINIVRGDMGFIGTRPWPRELYEEHLAAGNTLKRDMPSGLIGPVQSSKGDEGGEEEEQAYWELYKHGSAWALMGAEVRIVRRAVKVLLRHEGL